MMQVPTYQRQAVNTSVNYGSRASSIMQNVASAGERLQARLSGAANAAVQLAEPQIKEETINAALQDVQDGKIDSERVALVAKDIYKNTANSALIASTEVSGNKLGTDMIRAQEAANKYDLKGFMKSWDAYSKSTIKGIKDIEIRQNVASKLDLQGQKFGAQIGTLQTKQQRKLQIENFNAKMVMDVEGLNAAFGVNPQEAVRLQNEISTTLQTMVDSNLIAPNTAQLEQKKIAKGAYISSMQRGLTAAINSGNAYKFYENFKSMDHQGILDVKDVEAFRQSIQSQISTDVKVYNQQLQAAETQFKLTEMETIDTFNDELMQGSLTTATIDNALATGKIDLATHKTYTDKISVKGRLVDDTNAKLTFQTHVLDFTEDEIINSPHLTDKTKWDLIKQRRSEIKDENNWLSSQSGREARDRIKRTFNIIDGTLMAQMDFNNKNMQDYDELYRNFYAEVESLPFDQRASKSISIADKYIKQYKTAKIEEKTKRAEARKAKKEADEKKSEDTYGDTAGKFMNMLQDKWNSATTVWEDMN